VIKYLGSKRVLLPAIREAIAELLPHGRVLDLFSGTSRVGQALKQDGYQVVANDHNLYAATIAKCYIEADHQDWSVRARREITRLQQLADGLDTDAATAGNKGEACGSWFTEDYCRRSRYFQVVNGLRIEMVREAIAAAAYPPLLEAILLVSLLEAADRVDSTAGVQMAYLKQWAARSHNRLELRLPELHARPAGGDCEAWCEEALVAAERFDGELAYLDPPYNHHSYLGNYHVWETLVRWDAPETYGVACKRTDVQQRKSAFNSKRACEDAFTALLEALSGKKIVVSFSDEGFLPRERLEQLLRHHGHLETRSFGHERYVGARIGIHNPQGERVGTVSHTRNREYLFLLNP